MNQEKINTYLQNSFESGSENSNKNKRSYSESFGEEIKKIKIK